MSFESKFGYNWYDINPSKEMGLVCINKSIYENDGSCAWLTRRSYSNEILLDMEQDNLHSSYPTLFEQLELLMPQSHLAPQMDDIERYTKNYFRGVTLSIISMEASCTPYSHLQDVTEDYAKLYQDMDGVDQASWLYDFRRMTNKNTESLRRFVFDTYRLSEAWEDIAMIISGAQNAYVLEAHFMACQQRESEIYRKEEELSWDEREYESFEGWLAYERMKSK